MTLSAWRVIAISDAAQRTAHASSFEGVTIGLGSVLGSHDLCGECSPREEPVRHRRTYGRQRQRRIEARKQGISDDLAAAGIENELQVAEPGDNPKTEAHSLKLKLVVMMTLRLSWSSSTPPDALKGSQSSYRTQSIRSLPQNDHQMSA